jgi:hypothetical protein
MSTTGPRSQIPLNRAIVDQNGYLTVPWSFWFQSQNAGLPPAGAGYVIDGSAAQVTMTLFQGADSQKGSPQSGYIFFALDTGKTYVSVGNQWVLQDPAYTGDVTKSQGSTVTTLANVFGSPGTYGASSQIPVLTIDSKGRVIGVSLVQATASAGGSNNEVQFNNSGVISGTFGITYDGATQAFVFANSQPTMNNLSPLTSVGDLMTRDVANNTTRLPVGTNGQILIANSAANVGLTWIDHNYIANGTSNVNIPTANGNIQLNVNGNLAATIYDTGISSVGNVSAPYFIGNILANVVNANAIIGNTIDITGNANLGNVFANEIYANLANITGNITANYAILNGVISNTANIVGNAIIGNISTTDITANTANISGNIDIGGNINYTKTYGSFTSNVTQNVAGVNTATYMTFNNTGIANGISIVGNSNVTIQRVGIYNIQFSAQLTHTDNQPANIEIWLDKNGAAVANTNTVLTLLKDQATVASWNFVEQFSTANNYFRLGWASTEANAKITAFAANATISNIAVPSIILSVVPVGA